MVLNKPSYMEVEDQERECIHRYPACYCCKSALLL